MEFVAWGFWSRLGEILHVRAIQVCRTGAGVTSIARKVASTASYISMDLLGSYFLRGQRGTAGNKEKRKEETTPPKRLINSLFLSLDSPLPFSLSVCILGMHSSSVPYTQTRPSSFIMVSSRFPSLHPSLFLCWCMRVSTYVCRVWVLLMVDVLWLFLSTPPFLPLFSLSYT